ncbi:OsmC family protein [Knoellia aerolata]|uniref:Osmotically inducible protein OsmC n=1 Tax=Knoellia aerolata DSM 18566 TaxID=1385519 RepID=A0A0A0JWP7_9MICO|nr:OsmC family protein [Knoellia aerolata]KGN41109.1 osmotically inducible protein OsmC [Knoellia aerolata DSM 18566]
MAGGHRTGAHTYRATIAWEGSTGGGYTAYAREHEGTVPPARDPVALSADPHFRGDADRANPEQLLVLAASSCQLLSFLHVAATAGLDVLDYTDDAEGVMPVGEHPLRLTRITLRPRVLVAAGSDVSRFEDLVHEAHEGCFIANSLTTEIVVQATVEVAPKESPT